MTNDFGYSKLSKYMVENGYTIFRKFSLVAARDLLYMQAELVELEKQLEELATQDRGGTGIEDLYDTNWTALSAEDVHETHSPQWLKALEIRVKLREYCRCDTNVQIMSLLNFEQQTPALSNTLELQTFHKQESGT